MAPAAVLGLRCWGDVVPLSVGWGSQLCPTDPSPPVGLSTGVMESGQSLRLLWEVVLAKGFLAAG